MGRVSSQGSVLVRMLQGGFRTNSIQLNAYVPVVSRALRKFSGFVRVGGSKAQVKRIIPPILAIFGATRGQLFVRVICAR